MDTSPGDDDYDSELWPARVCTDLGSTLDAFEVGNLQLLGELLDSRVDLTAWVELMIEGSAVAVGEDPDALLVRIDSRGVLLPFPFTVGEVWDELFELERELVVQYMEDDATEDEKALEEQRRRLAARIAEGPGPREQWDRWPGGWKGDIESALIDAVFSANAVYRGARGGGVHARVTGWQAGRAARRPTRDLRDLVAEIAAVGPAAWAVEFGSSQPSPGRAATAPGGATKAATVAQAARVLLDLDPPIATTEDLWPDRVEEVRRALRKVPGIGKATINYFLMLLGRPGVKPDRMVIRFVANTFRTPASHRAEFAERVITATAADLEVEPHVLEHAIWAWQRNQPIGDDDRPMQRRGAR